MIKELFVFYLSECSTQVSLFLKDPPTEKVICVKYFSETSFYLNLSHLERLEEAISPIVLLTCRHSACQVLWFSLNRDYRDLYYMYLWNVDTSLFDRLNYMADTVCQND